MQKTLQRQQFTAAAYERVRRRFRQRAQTQLAPSFLKLLDVLRRHGREQLRVLLLLIQHWHEPVLQTQFASAHHLAAIGVAYQLLLPGQHGAAHPLSECQLSIKSLDKPTGSLHQDAVAHGHH